MRFHGDAIAMPWMKWNRMRFLVLVFVCVFGFCFIFRAQNNGNAFELKTMKTVTNKQTKKPLNV